MEAIKNGGNDRGEKLGSLPVPNVQAVAASTGGAVGGDVLLRYTRPEAITNPGGYSDEIPVVDFSKLFLDGSISKEELSKLHFACEEWGFFQLINHGISNELIDKTKVVIQEFFQLPLEEKKAFAQVEGNLQGYGQVFVVSEDQTLDWGDMLLLRVQPPSERDMKFWPTQPPSFRDTLEMYTSDVRKVAHSLFELSAKNFGVEFEKFADMFAAQSVRINYYPPCPQADKVLGLSPHSDAVGLTLLLQVNQVEGLQIKNKGAWLPIKPLPGAFIVNVGDVLEVLSNGKYKSIEHRVTINPERERLSIATFHNLPLDSVVGPLPEIVQGSEERYETMSMGEFRKLYFTNKLDGKNLIDHVKLKK